MSANSPEQVLRDDISALSPYPVVERAGLVMLDAMENPYPLPETLQAAIAKLVSRAAINRYPDPQSAHLKERLRDAMEIPSGMEIMLGNGSDELIQIIALAVARPGASLLSMEPAFVMYRMIAVYSGLRFTGVQLNPDFTLDVEAVIAAIDQFQPAVIFIAYPNNPTGNLFDREGMTRIIKAAPGLVVIDEAYHIFAEESFMPLLAEVPNLLVMRTLSKLGMAGLRLGFLVGRREWLAQLEKLRLPYNVNVLTQIVAEKLLQHMDVLRKQAREIRSQREQLYKELSKLPSVRAYRSDANFILFRVTRADEVFNGLIKRGILIKNLNRSHSLLENCLRVTVGTARQNQQFIQALKQGLIP
ncbi:MAG TPA: histidinol-phosphate transaminase [Burkholderiales bacterium]|nr:histidinol-phosphate transaminase [Burkholderiales bacterium]